MTADIGVGAREEIRDLLARYCRGVDRMDADLIASAYHPDAIDEHGITQFTGETVGAGIVALMQSARFSMHHVTNQLIQLHDDDHAGCETYYVVWQTIPDEGGEQLLHVLGRYVDRLERRDGEWRIAHRASRGDCRNRATDSAGRHRVPRCTGRLPRPKRPVLRGVDRAGPAAKPQRLTHHQRSW